MWKQGLLYKLSVSNLQSALPSDMLILTKEAFLSFVSDVLVGAKKATNRSDIIRLVVGAAERFLDIKQMPEELHQYMKESYRFVNCFVKLSKSW